MNNKLLNLFWIVFLLMFMAVGAETARRIIIGTGDIVHFDTITRYGVDDMADTGLVGDTTLIWCDFGTAANEVCEGDDARIPTTDEKAAMTGANSPSAANVFATMTDVAAGETGVELITGTHPIIITGTDQPDISFSDTYTYTQAHIDIIETAFYDSPYIDTNKADSPMNGYTLLILNETERLDSFLTETIPSGVLETITVSDSGILAFAWSSGEVHVNGIVLEIDAGNDTAVTNDRTYLYATPTSGSTLQTSTTYPTGDYALVATIDTYDSDIEHIYQREVIGETQEDIETHLDLVHNEIVSNGLLVADDTNATNANDFTITSGVYYHEGLDKHTISSTLYSAGSGHGDNNVNTYYHTTGNVWTQGISNGIDFSNWDNDDGDAGVDGTTAGKWYAGWIFLVEVDEIEYVYPQQEHAKEQDALQEAVTYPPYHTDFAVTLAKFIFKHGQSAFGSKAYFVDIRPIHIKGIAGETVFAVQDLWKTITGDSGSTDANLTYDILTIAGGTNATTVMSGDTLTVNIDGYTQAQLDAKFTDLDTAKYDSPTVDTLLDAKVAKADTGNWELAYTHIGESGASHTYVDQSVVSGASPTFTGANFTAIDADDVNIADAGSKITATQVEGALQENRTAIDLNTAKNTNVSTALSTGTVNAITYGITSDGGTDDIVLEEANADSSGLLGAAKWAEIVANTLKDTNVSTTLSEGTRDDTTYGINSDGSSPDIILPQANTNEAGLLSGTKWDEIVANTAAKHTQNTDTDLDATFEATFVKKTDTVNVLSDITSAGADIEDAVTKKHASASDNQNLWEGIRTDTGAFSADSTADTVWITGGTDIQVTNSGDTIIIDYTGTGGVGDMTKAVYDPNADDKIAEAQLALDIGTMTLWKNTQFNAFRIGNYEYMIDGFTNDFTVSDEGIDTTLSDTYLYDATGDYYYQEGEVEGEAPATLVYWSKLETAGDITSPQVGVGGTVDGTPTYVACKFSDGIYCDTPGEAFHVPNTGSFLSGNECTLEFWIKTDFNVVNGIASDAATHTMSSLNPAGSALMNFEFSTVSGFGINRRNDAAGWVACYDTTSDWTAGDLVHLAFVWDIAAGFDATKTMAVYVNGVETASTTTALGAFTDDTTNFYVCDGSSLTLGLDAIIDNIKIWDYAKIDFSDRNTEGYASTGGGDMELYTSYYQIGLDSTTVKAMILSNDRPDTVYLSRLGTGSTLTQATLSDSDIFNDTYYSWNYTADVSGEASDTAIRCEIVQDDTTTHFYAISILGLE